MKRILLATVAFSLLATPMAFAQNYYHKDNTRHHEEYKPRKHHHWTRGRPLPMQYRGHVVRDYSHYRLHRPPHGYHWVQVDNDFLLVGITSGIISSIIGAR